MNFGAAKCTVSSLGYARDAEWLATSLNQRLGRVRILKQGDSGTFVKAKLTATSAQVGSLKICVYS